MRSRWFGVSLVAVSTVAGLMPALAPVPAAATPATKATAATATKATAEPAPGPAAVIIARYAFNGRSGSILDESGRGHTLRVISGHGGSVRQVVHGQGTALAFPPRCTRRVCPHVALQARTSPDLNPGTRNIAYGADVLLTPGQTSKGQNVVQKGYSATSSQWKLQIDGAAGRPSCVLVGDRQPMIRMVTSAISVADGRWHSVSCHRVSTSLTIYVDGVARGRTGVPARLSVTNSRPLSIGGKGAYVDNDQFNGALDNVWVRVG
ncbi:MAG: LamG-like jellyroll fold domain-containing protein [Actinoplanes sp.]